MAAAIYIPEGLGDAVLQLIAKYNNGDTSIEMILIAVKTDTPPALISSVHPSQVPDVLQWLIEHHESANVVVEDLDQRKDN